jgi:3-oxoacyl-[acyl-carrier protein] reductase
MKFDDITIGLTAELSHQLTMDDVSRFIDLTGDDNKIHIDSDFAAKTPLKKPVAHGMLGASFISTIIGTQLPGDGALWFSQNLEFILPVRVGDILTISAEVINKDERTHIIELRTDISNQNNQKVTRGTAKVKIIDLDEDLPDKEYDKSIYRKALVVGGSGGIGSAVCSALASKGFDVGIHYYTNSINAERLVDEARKQGLKAFSYRADITNISEVEEMVRLAARKLGDISVLINCASEKIIAKPFKNVNWVDFELHLNNQIQGNLNLVNAVLPHFEKNGYGRIINIDTQYVDSPEVNMLPYITAKSALRGFSKSLALDLAPKGIRVNSVSPGMTDTDQLTDVPHRVQMVTAARTPVRRLATPKDVANAVAFLASEESDFLCGEIVRVNGGQVML